MFNSSMLIFQRLLPDIVVEKTHTHREHLSHSPTRYDNFANFHPSKITKIDRCSMFQPSKMPNQSGAISPPRHQSPTPAPRGSLGHHHATRLLRCRQRRHRGARGEVPGGSRWDFFMVIVCLFALKKLIVYF